MTKEVDRGAYLGTWMCRVDRVPRIISFSTIISAVWVSAYPWALKGSVYSIK